MKIQKLFENKDLIKLIPEFLELYQGRPFKDNPGGMGLNHSFALYAIIKHFPFNKVYESGIYRGHSTWLIENTKKDVEVVSIDIDLNLREYISKNTNVSYFEGDFEDLDLSDCDFENTLFFFDDHTNVINRLKHLYSWGAKFAIFEDNYPPGQGDSYSIRKIKSGTGQSLEEWNPDFKVDYKNSNNTFKNLFSQKSKMGNSLPYFLTEYFYFQNKLRKPNSSDLAIFDKIVKNDYEIQPIYNYEKTRWGSEWNGSYISLDPLIENFESNKLNSKELNYLKELLNHDSIFNYTYFSFVELNN